MDVKNFVADVVVIGGGAACRAAIEAEELGAEFIVTDSLLCSAHLKRIAPDGKIKVLWLPEIVA